MELKSFKHLGLHVIKMSLIGGQHTLSAPAAQSEWFYQILQYKHAFVRLSLCLQIWAHFVHTCFTLCCPQESEYLLITAPRPITPYRGDT